MVEKDLGRATIAYEDPDDGTVERTVQNEHVAYFQEHWIVKAGEDERGRDLVRRIPHQRVYYVERSVEAFEEEVKTLRDQVQSVADGLRSKLLGGESREERDVQRIDVESGDPADGGSRNA
ncbi:hypothetical protein [Halegenticoccus tardaugens]|uniref:hypothetical protein n=1 Tax=Halegenticoccus tardaugens TaxID=2071624 RepID=UPI00100A9189|nr:hypothetical protein [Halegenticoccus tardaugens]